MERAATQRTGLLAGMRPTLRSLSADSVASHPRVCGPLWGAAVPRSRSPRSPTTPAQEENITNAASSRPHVSCGNARCEVRAGQRVRYTARDGSGWRTRNFSSCADTRKGHTLDSAASAPNDRVEAAGSCSYRFIRRSRYTSWFVHGGRPRKRQVLFEKIGPHGYR